MRLIQWRNSKLINIKEFALDVPQKQQEEVNIKANTKGNQNIHQIQVLLILNFRASTANFINTTAAQCLRQTTSGEGLGETESDKGSDINCQSKIYEWALE